MRDQQVDYTPSQTTASPAPIYVLCADRAFWESPSQYTHFRAQFTSDKLVPSISALHSRQFVGLGRTTDLNPLRRHGVKFLKFRILHTLLTYMYTSSWTGLDSDGLADTKRQSNEVFASEAYVQKETPDVPARPMRGYASRTFHELDHRATSWTNGGRLSFSVLAHFSPFRGQRRGCATVVGPVRPCG